MQVQQDEVRGSLSKDLIRIDLVLYLTPGEVAPPVDVPPVIIDEQDLALSLQALPNRGWNLRRLPKGELDPLDLRKERLLSIQKRSAVIVQ